MIRLRRRPEPLGWDDDDVLTEMRRAQQKDNYGPTGAEWTAMFLRENARMQAALAERRWRDMTAAQLATELQVPPLAAPKKVRRPRKGVT
ncbi:MAG: hypothetical protein M3042_10210 [Actinomycetota bacterium]|nr:hypothetical protein [Actinomycetota bacterium]